jgi:hypothetical protein
MSRWQISAGGMAVWLPLLLYAFAALSSAWTLHDARARRFPPYAVAAWTLATLIYAPVFLPLYLIARIYKPSPVARDDATETPDPQDTVTPDGRETVMPNGEEAVTSGSEEFDESDEEETGAGGLEEIGAGGLEETCEAGVAAACVEIAADTGEHVAADTVVPFAAPVVPFVAPVEQAVAPVGQAVAPVEQIPAADAPQASRFFFSFRRHAPTLIYTFALLFAGAIYFYRDYHSFDAHLERAAGARLRSRRHDAIREYRAALRIDDDAHTHKLLGVQLAEDGQTEAALAELRAAERGGEPDPLLTFRLASALDALGRAVEAAGEYQKFVQGDSCAHASPGALCAEAAARLRQIRGGDADTP